MKLISERIIERAESAPFWDRLARSPLWDIMAIGVILVSLYRYAALMPQAAHASDFSHYYLSSRMLLDGRSPYTTPLEPKAKDYDLVLSPDSMTGTNPPLLQWLFAPFATLKPRAAFWLWSLLQAGALAIILGLTRLELAGRLTTRAWRFVVCGAIASVPMLIHFTESQTQLLIGALLLSALVLLRNDRPTAACLTTVVAALLKLFPVVLLPWFVWRGGRTWRQRAMLAGVSAAAIAVGVMISRPSLWQDFLRNGLPLVAYWSRNFTFNYCLASFVAHCCGWSWNLGLAVGWLALLGAYVICLRRRDDYEAQFCLLTMAMLAGGATSWSHYMVLAIFPAAAMVARVAVNPSWPRIVLLAVAVMALDNVDAPISAFPQAWHLVKLLWIYTPLYGQLILAAMFVMQPTPQGTRSPDFEAAH